MNRVREIGDKRLKQYDLVRLTLRCFKKKLICLEILRYKVFGDNVLVCYIHNLYVQEGG